MKYVLVGFAFIAIIGSLATALFFMLRGEKEGSDKKKGNMATALAFRVGFSILLFLCILAAYKLGWIQPTGIRAGQ
ncbi:MAG TPA: twin transmembrane helix small protein [Ramlibacter sp.]|uniref:twin transmembrane helix small protein n=1 Tax=Ramlibacter sp. TaxID=1917967 RepID=UPI002CFA2C34|nr:twin transmembrane helix small protein [Ramlibacter sp.]HVZ44544.1 twin transmembrane helix small protein [Ramlibacter sp.]